MEDKRLEERGATPAAPHTEAQPHAEARPHAAAPAAETRPDSRRRFPTAGDLFAMLGIALGAQVVVGLLGMLFALFAGYDWNFNTMDPRQLGPWRWADCSGIGVRAGGAAAGPASPCGDSIRRCCSGPS